MIRIPECDAGASKHVGVLTIYKILFLYIYDVTLTVHLTINLVKTNLTHNIFVL
jgi:hypothetical protein